MHVFPCGTAMISLFMMRRSALNKPLCDGVLVSTQSKKKQFSNGCARWFEGRKVGQCLSEAFMAVFSSAEALYRRL